MAKTLKELKREYPELITTSGNTYKIDGLGWFKQIKGYTYTKDWDDSWIRTSFEDLEKYMRQMYRQ